MWEPPPCPKCGSTDRVIVAKTIGEGIYRRLHRTQNCRDCDYCLAIL